MYKSLIDFEKETHYIFPSSFVWWTKLENHTDIKEKYLPLIDTDYHLNKDAYNSKNSWDGLVSSSYFNSVPISPIFDNSFFNMVVWNALDKMLDELVPSLNILAPKQSKISQAWYNKYDPGFWQEIHDHSRLDNKGDSFSGIYLMDLNEKNGTIFYEQKNLRCFSPERSHYFSTENIEEGYVILFPSELAHFVKPSVNNRTTVSFNITSDYGDIPSN